jgi:hypothetical protein
MLTHTILHFLVGCVCVVGVYHDILLQTHSLSNSLCLSKVSIRGHRNSDLEGSLPTELGSLVKLSEFWIHKTNIGGTIPSEMVGPKMMMLSDLRLHATALTGPTIPTQLWSLTNLQRLDLYETQISGSIPTEIANLSNLVILRLRDMPNLSSTIPTEIGMLTKLARVWLEGTNLTGPIPEALCAIRPDVEDAAAAFGNTTTGAGGEGESFVVAEEGEYFFSELTADCHPSLLSSEAANSCPMGCCTLCCDRDLGNCSVPLISLP